MRCKKALIDVALPIEAQRLGLEAYASDLNPVAVLICKALVEIPPKFAGKPPIFPGARASRPHNLRPRQLRSQEQEHSPYGA